MTHEEQLSRAEQYGREMEEVGKRLGFKESALVFIEDTAEGKERIGVIVCGDGDVKHPLLKGIVKAVSEILDERKKSSDTAELFDYRVNGGINHEKENPN